MEKAAVLILSVVRCEGRPEQEDGKEEKCHCGGYCGTEAVGRAAKDCDAQDLQAGEREKAAHEDDRPSTVGKLAFGAKAAEDENCRSHDRQENPGKRGGEFGGQRHGCFSK